jgi:hypothetical protein
MTTKLCRHAKRDLGLFAAQKRNPRRWLDIQQNKPPDQSRAVFKA